MWVFLILRANLILTELSFELGLDQWALPLLGIMLTSFSSPKSSSNTRGQFWGLLGQT